MHFMHINVSGRSVLLFNKLMAMIANASLLLFWHNLYTDVTVVASSIALSVACIPMHPNIQRIRNYLALYTTSTIITGQFKAKNVNMFF